MTKVEDTMQFSLAHDETPAELVSRLYEIKGRNAPTIRARAEAAVLEANPHLAEQTPAAETDRAGDRRSAVPEPVIPKVIVVPEVEGARTKADDLPHNVAIGHLVSAVGGATEALEGHLTDTADRGLAQARAALKLAKTAKVRKLVKEQPELGDRVKRLAKGAEERIKGDAELRKRQVALVAQVRADAAALLAQVAPLTGTHFDLIESFLGTALKEAADKGSAPKP
jgi:hypothetical protein